MTPTANLGPDTPSPSSAGGQQAGTESVVDPKAGVQAGIPGDHDPDAKALLRRYLAEIHSFREMGNQALRNLEARLASLPVQGAEAPMAEPARPVQQAAPRQTSQIVQPSLTRNEARRPTDPSLKQRLNELSAYLHADLSRESAGAPAATRQAAQAAPRQPEMRQQTAAPRAPQPAPQMQAPPQSQHQAQPQSRPAQQPQQPQRPAAQQAQPRPQQPAHGTAPQGHQQSPQQPQNRTPSQPVLDRAWFEERFAALRTSIDRLAEEVPLKRLQALELQFSNLMDRLAARETGRETVRDTHVMDASLRELAAYLSDNRQWQKTSDQRMKGMEDRLEHLSGLVAQSTAAISATVKGLETVAKDTSEKLVRATAGVIIARLGEKIDRNNPAERLDVLTRDVAEIKGDKTPERIETLRQEIAQLARNNPSERVEALRLEVAALARANPAERLEQLGRDVAKIALQNTSDRLEQLGREVAHLAAQSRMNARNAEDRLEQIETSLKEKARGIPQLPTGPDRPPPGPLAADPKHNTHSELESYLNRQPDSDDDYDSDMIAAAQRAARLADTPARSTTSRDGPVRYQIPYGEFLPDDQSPSSRTGLIVAVVILLLAGAVMLFLKAKQWTLIEPRPAATLSEPVYSAVRSKQAKLAGPEAAAVASSDMASTGTIIPVPVVTGSTPAAPPLNGRPLQLWVSAKAPETAATEPRPEPAKPSEEDGSLREAAIKGDPNAQFSVGQNYLSGAHGEANLSGDDRLVRAARWFRRAAEGGHVPSQYRLATLYELGQGTPRDLAEAETWYERAASRGHVKAMHNLAVLSASQNKRSANYITAAKWFRQAASYGLIDSQYNLGVLHERGMGVPKNVAEAYFWFALAGRQQDANALQKQDEIGRQLTPAEREKMDSIVAAWKPKARIEDVNRVAPEPPATAQEDDKPVGPTPVAATLNTAVMRASWKPDIAPVSRGSAQTEMIAEAQRLLKRMGYEAGPVDGRQGPRTQAAVRSFQRRAGLAETGQITQELIVKMAFLPL